MLLVALGSFLTCASAQRPPAAAKEPSKPTPRLADGKVDFGGKGVWAPIWVQDWADKKWVDEAIDVPFTAWGQEDRKSTRLNSSHIQKSRMPSSA